MASTARWRVFVLRARHQALRELHRHRGSRRRVLPQAGVSSTAIGCSRHRGVGPLGVRTTSPRAWRVPTSSGTWSAGGADRFFLGTVTRDHDDLGIEVGSSRFETLIPRSGWLRQVMAGAVGDGGVDGRIDVVVADEVENAGFFEVFDHRALESGADEGDVFFL